MSWLLVIFASGVMTPTTLSVDNIVDEAQCRQLGEQLLARYKSANSALRYSFECYGVKRIQPSQP